AWSCAARSSPSGWPDHGTGPAERPARPAHYPASATLLRCGGPSVLDDADPHVGVGAAPVGVQVPAAGRGEDIARAPLLARLVPVATAVRFRAPHRPVPHARRADRGERERPGAGHPPDDLLLVTDARRPEMGEHQQPPELRPVTGAL